MARGIRLGFALNPLTLQASPGRFGLLTPRSTLIAPPAIPGLIQQATDRWPGQNTAAPPDNSQSLTRTLTATSSVTAGNSIVVFGVTYNLGQTGHGITISDNQGNTWPASSKTVEDLVENLTWCVFCLPRLASSGSGYTITATFSLLEWQGLWMTEWSNLASSPVIDANGRIQTASGSGGALTDQLSTSLSGGSNTGVVIAVGHNTTDANAANGGGVGAPNTGTGWTNANSGIIDWNGLENEFVGPGGACEYLIYTSAMGTVTPTFSPKKGAENYCTIAIALKGA